MVTGLGSRYEADVVVYGDAAVGVAAAVQAGRMGASVLLISPHGHLGGMTSSGLGWTDIGNTAILGGIAREFYHRVFQHYAQDSAWNREPRANFPLKAQGALAFDPATELGSVFEPKVAEAIFDTLVKEAGVRVVQGRLDLRTGVEQEDHRIRCLRLEGDVLIAGQMFVDASYEGDLLALADVPFTVGRESNACYGEVCNGNTGVARKNQLPDGIDPYVTPGVPSSGLLPGVHPGFGGERGDGDHRIQAFCYRMVLTDVPENRVMIKCPAGYDPCDYEILFRAIETGADLPYFKTSLMPNRKTDSNNDGGVSCDYIGMNYGDDWDWTTLSYPQRERVAAAHRDWQLGLVWTVQNHPRVPEEIRQRFACWGLPRDEFTDTDHWPFQLYVREGRRMLSDVVMTEHHCRCEEAVPDPIGMGAYTMDSHNTQRGVVQGMVKNEGDIQRSLGGRPYGIAYRAMVPPRQACRNLLVPWCLSASHIAFGSIRMEPVGMVLGQSAATAAVLAWEQGLAVQDVPYAQLRNKLEADRQVLSICMEVEQAG